MRPEFLALLAVLVLASLAASVLAGPLLIHQLASHASGPLLFTAAAFVLLLVGVVPGGLLGIAAGALYGPAIGFALCDASVLAAAAAAFGLARSYLRPLVATLMHRTGALARLDAALTEDSWRLVALLRVSPVMPFSLTSYGLGLSGISFGGYALGTLASLPPLLGYVVVGALVRQGAGGGTLLHHALLALGAAATLALVIHLSRLTSRALAVPTAQNPG